MNNNYIPKCKPCKGTGLRVLKMDDRSSSKLCPHCEGLGVKLRNEIDEELDDFLTITDSKTHHDEASFIEIEEEDYEV